MSDKTEVILLKRLRKSLNPIERKEEVMECPEKQDKEVVQKYIT